jgi:hypothetical protein
MDSYIVRIYRRSGRKPSILVGTVETAGIRQKIAFSTIEELWEILRRRKGRDPGAPPSLRRHLQKEVMSGRADIGLEGSAEGVRQIKSTLEP